MLLHPASYHSKFGGLWTDMANAHTEVETKLYTGTINQEEAELLTFWINKGYVILKNAVNHDVIDAILQDMNAAWETVNDNQTQIKLETGNVICRPEPHLRYTPGYKLLDAYVFYNSIRQAMFAPKITRFFQLIYENDILAFQSLSFEMGTQQPIHQDTAFVACSSPMQIAAAWIALEDIQEGSGELMYYEGSHRIEEFLWDGVYKYYMPDYSKDRTDSIEKFYNHLHTKSQEKNLPLKKFLAQKGDVLIWSADLAHGGSPITKPDATRRSVVIHYCPNTARPRYFDVNGKDDFTTKKKFNEHCFYSSGNYLLEPDSAESNVVVATKTRKKYFWF